MSPSPLSQPQRLRFEDFLNFEGNPDIRYELWHGRLIVLPTPTLDHGWICQFLVSEFQQAIAAHNLDFTCLTNVAVRTEKDTVRIPDVLICPRPLWHSIQDRPRRLLDLGETPALIVEITRSNWRDDYILKTAEYAYNQIPEYWIVNPTKKQFWLMTHPEGDFGYRKTEVFWAEPIRSKILPPLNLTPEQILSPPEGEAIAPEQKW